MPQAKLLKSGSNEAFWGKHDPANTANAVRQLTNSLHKGGRKTKPLPGSKLQPLFKNYTAPPRLEHQFSSKNVVPSIGAVNDQESLIKHVMSGNTEDLPSAQANTVRVFLASNYDDMLEERGVLLKKAVPQVQALCSEYGLNFQLVDLHWGVDINMVNRDFNVRNIHQREITDCQTHSLGPNFVALLGDKYGSQQLISEIPEEEFDVFHEIATENDTDGLLGHYYLRDTNAVPVAYRLQTIEESTDVLKLITTIRDCAVKAYEDNKISLSRKKHFLISTLEEDVKQGITETKDPRKHCLCYRREFQNIREHLEAPTISQFFEGTQKNEKFELDETNYKASLKLADAVSHYLGVGNYRPYYIPWKEEGIKTSDPDFQNYLARLSSDFVNDMKHLIVEQAEKLLKASKQVEKSVLQEVLHHSVLSREKTTHFKGQSDVLFRLEKFFRNPRENKKPFVIHGEPGSGKSTVMAKIAMECKKWFTEDCVVVYRCLGTSSHCSSIYRTVMNITLQICMAYNLPLPNINNNFCTLHKTLVTFRETLMKVSVEHAFMRPLFILLDGIHELQPHDESLRAMWAIRDLPTNIQMVISTIPQLGAVDILNPLIQLVTDRECVMEVSELSESQAEEIISETFERNNRTLTDIQKRTLLEGYIESKNPLMLQVLVDEALDWTSYAKPSEFKVSESVDGCISSVLDGLEDEYGAMLTMAFGSYITASPTGVQEREFVDLLMLDQDAEEDVEKFPNAVSDGIMYLPPYLLAQFKFKLRNFLTEHLVYGRKGIAWRHKKFYGAVGEKYQVIFPGINEKKITEDATSYTLMLHENMTNMYLTENRQETLSLIGDKNKRKKVKKPLTNPQPVNRNNLLKLQRVPTHLRVMAPVEGLSRAKEAVMFNFHWLHTKIQALPLFMCMQDIVGLYNISQHLQETQNHQIMDETSDVEILFEFLQLSEKALVKNPSSLAAEVFGRLQGYRDYQYLDQLFKEALLYVENTDEKMIIPMYSCFKPPQQLLRHKMQGPTHFLGFLRAGKVVVMASQKYGVDLWSVITGELIHRFKVNPEQKIDKIIPGHKNEFLIVAHYSHLNHETTLRVISTETGVDLVRAIFPQNFEAIALNKADNTIIVAASVLVEDEERKCLIAVSVHTKDVLYTLPQQDVHEEGVTQMLFVSLDKQDDSLITIGSKKSKDLAFWSLEKEEMEYKLELNCFVEKISVFQTTAVCVSAREGVLLFIDLKKGEIVKRIEDTELIGLTDMIVSNNGKFIMIATRHSGVTIYDSSSYNIVKTVGDESKNKKNTPLTICTDPQQVFLCVGYDTGGIGVYLLATGQEVLTLWDEHHSSINTLHFTAQFKLFSSSQDNVSNVWNLGKPLLSILEQLPGNVGNNGDDESQFKTEEASVELKGKDDDLTYPGERDKVTSYAMTADDKLVFTAQLDGALKVWNVDTGKLERTLTEGSDSGAVDVYLAYGDNVLIAHCVEPGISNAYRLEAWNLKNYDKVDFDGTNLLYTACLYPKGDKLLTVAPMSQKHAGMTFIVYDLFDLKKVAELECNIFGNMNSNNLKFIGMSKNIATRKKRKKPVEEDTVRSAKSSLRTASSRTSSDETDNNLYCILDYFPEENVSFFFTIVLQGDDNINISMAATDPIELDSVSPKCTLQLKDGNCVTGTIEGELVVWNSATQRTVATFYDRSLMLPGVNDRLSMRRAHNTAVTVVTANSSLLLSGDVSGVVKVWNMNRKLLHTLVDNSTQINSLWLGHGNDVLLTGSAGEEIQAYSVESGELLTTLNTHSAVMRVSGTRDLSRVIALSASSKLIILQTKNM